MHIYFEKVGSTAFSVPQNLDFAWKTDASRLIILNKHMNYLERINNQPRTMEQSRVTIMRGASVAVNTARNARKITSAAVNIFSDVSDD